MVDEATDAQVWTEEFLTVVPDTDPGLMLGWFANAIEAGALREAARYDWIPGWATAIPGTAGRWYVHDDEKHRKRCQASDGCVPLYRQVTEGEGL